MTETLVLFAVSNDEHQFHNLLVKGFAIVVVTVQLLHFSCDLVKETSGETPSFSGLRVLCPVIHEGHDQTVCCCTAKSDGRSVFSFVFLPSITELNDLPENTHLERGLKQRYLSGGYIYSFSGVSLL